MTTPSLAVRAAVAGGYMCPDEVRKHLALGASTISKLVREGLLERVGRGRGTRYTRTSVERFAARRLIEGR